MGRHWQFKLQHLFGLMTIAAVAAALFAARGRGTLLTSAGFLIAWLNLCGAFEDIQAGRRQRVALGLAWGIFLVSFALPSITVFGPVYGYGAAWFAIAAPFGAVREGEVFHPEILWFLAINLANLLAVCLPLLIWRLSCGRGDWLAAALCVAMVATWFVCWDTEMLAGYFVWCASFLVALVAVRVRPWTLAAMVGMAFLIFTVVDWH